MFEILVLTLKLNFALMIHHVSNHAMLVYLNKLFSLLYTENEYSLIHVIWSG